MESIKELYRIGHGPSSSHTMGPALAANIVRVRFPNATLFEVILYNSLALTGYGHLTFQTIENELKPSRVNFKTIIDQNVHPNKLIFNAFSNEELIGSLDAVSVGGGKVILDGDEAIKKDIYKQKNFKEIKDYCIKKKIDLFEYLLECEGTGIASFLRTIWDQMKKTILKGLKETGFLPSELQVNRKAKKLMMMNEEAESLEDKKVRLISAYSFACSEENASGGIIVTAPTCGACGVLPACLYYCNTQENVDDEKIVEALAVAGIIGNVIKHNASISGAEAGCQAEIGSACAMAAAAISYIKGYDIDLIEYSAEVALEHSLGLTCDPVKGYVQIPCIERNAIYAMKALSAVAISKLTSRLSRVSLDTVIETMFETGKDLGYQYRETAEGGLAKYYKDKRAK